MKKNFLSLILILFFTNCFSQPSDFITLKKNQQTKKTFFAGSRITFATSLRTYSGVINSIQRDSVFILEYDIRQMPTTLGFFIPDTVTIYKSGINYTEITKVYIFKTGFDKSASGASLFGGGILLTAVGLGTWIFTKPGTQYHASTALVAGSAALAGVGYLLLRSHSDYYSIGKKYKLDYIKVK